MRKWSACLLAVGLALCLWAAACLGGIPSIVQRAFPWAEGKEFEADEGSMHAVGQRTLRNERNRQLDGLLYAVDEQYFTRYRALLRDGRLPYGHEYRAGRRVCVVNESLALKLFKTASPLGQRLVLDDEKYVIVGVVRDEPRVGSTKPCRAYIPLAAARQAKLSFEAMMISALPGEETGLKGGALWDLGREKARALLPLRFALALSTLGLLCVGFRWYVRWFTQQRSRMRAALTQRYLSDVWWRLIVRALPLALGGMLLLAASVLLMRFAVQPLYQFPELVPKVLTEWSEIAKVYWAHQENNSSVILVRTAQALQVEHAATLIQVGSLCLLGGWAFFRRRKKSV